MAGIYLPRRTGTNTAALSTSRATTIRIGPFPVVLFLDTSITDCPSDQLAWTTANLAAASRSAVSTAVSARGHEQTLGGLPDQAFGIEQP